jgi:hypothetical protein
MATVSLTAPFRKHRLQAPLKSFKVTKPRNTARKVLADKAASLLGYTKLQKEIKTPGRLGMALLELEIQPLVKSTVVAYKEKRLDRERRKYEKENMYGNRYTQVLWKEQSLEGYKEEVPEFVLNKAVQIAEKVPGTKFFVEELKVVTKTVDPFLIARHGGEEYYIEVWDEPKFEGKL